MTTLIHLYELILTISLNNTLGDVIDGRVAMIDSLGQLSLLMSSVIALVIDVICAADE